jgi:Flp pilus assembly protein TadD
LHDKRGLVTVATAGEILGRAWQKHQAGQNGEAEQLCRLVAQAQPANFDAWCLLGVICHALAKPDEAEANLRQAVALVPDSVKALNLLGAVLILQKRWADAKACFMEVLRFEPDNADAVTYRHRRSSWRATRNWPWHITGTHCS